MEKQAILIVQEQAIAAFLPTQAVIRLVAWHLPSATPEHVGKRCSCSGVARKIVGVRAALSASAAQDRGGLRVCQTEALIEQTALASPKTSAVAARRPDRGQLQSSDQ
jgi:hypothetical protein